MDSKPLVSIIIPMYNAEKWIRYTIESVLQQTWNRTEIIVIDDGSDDNSVALAEDVLGKRGTIIRQDRSGASTARNKALDLASGDYIQYLDADDLLHPDKIRLQVNALSSQPSNAVASCRYGIFKKTPSNSMFYDGKLWCTLSPVDWLLSSYETGEAMALNAWLFPKATIDKAGGWNEKLSTNDDGEYVSRVMMNCEKVIFVYDAIAYYRADNEMSLSSVRTRKAMESLLLSVKLSCTNLIDVENSSRTRNACGHLYARTARILYPYYNDLACQAEETAKQLLGSPLNFEHKLIHRLLEHLLGWKTLARGRIARRAITAAIKKVQG